jgi:ATP-dependent DNA helicase RecG
MFEECIRESKAHPDFTGSDEYQVSVALLGDVQDPRFLRFLEQVSKETQASFSMQDLLVLDWLHREEAVPQEFRDRLTILREQGVVEIVGRGRGTRYILSRRLYGFLDKKGVYTRKRGLDRETNKALLLKHLDNFGKAGIKEFEEALPGLTRRQIHSLLQGLREVGLIRRVGEKRGSLWERS